MSKKIAVTGGLSSGKSTVCKLFKDLGAYVVSADEIVHKLLTAETNIGKQVIRLFGNDILTHGQLDRSKIAKKAFSDPTLLHALEQLIHPEVRHEIENEYKRSCSSYPLFVAEVPLLFETGWERDYSATIAVVSELDMCQKRFKSKMNGSLQDFQQRAARQLSNQEKAAKATYVIENNFSLEALKLAVNQLYQRLLS